MIALSVLTVILSAPFCHADPTIFPGDLMVGYLRNPLAVDSQNPRLSWKLYGKVVHNQVLNNLTQTAYQILAATRSDILFTKPDLWDTGKVKSNAQFGIRYLGKYRGPIERIFWTVRVWDQNDESSEYAKGYFWDNAFNVSHWTAHWISAPGRLQKSALVNITPEDRDVIATHKGLKPVIYLRKTFQLDSEVRAAKLYATAKGMYRLFVNEEPTYEFHNDIPLLTPGWTDYNQSLQYQVYNVSKLLRNKNTIGVMLGTGWYAGYVGWFEKYGHYGHKEAFLMELHIELKNGSEIIIKSDNSWKVSTGPVIYSDLYQGELYYEDRNLNDWLNYDYNDTKWYGVDSVIIDKEISLVAEQSSPIKELDYYRAIKAWESSPGVWVYDFGTNWAGYVIITLNHFTSNVRIQVRHAEVLNPNGSIYTLNLRSARATETYLLNGDPKQRKEFVVLKPHFTYHGFRYVEVTGFPGMLNLTSIVSVRIGIEKINNGIQTDNELVTTLHRNIRTTHLSSFMSVPTDCTQRDERLGWMGDAGIFSHTGIYNGEVGGFFTKWMRDIREAQSPLGAFSEISPRVVINNDGEPAWASAGVVVPYNVYRMYGDLQTIEDNYDAMKKWIDYIYRDNPTLLWINHTNWIFGDWLNVNDETPETIVATAYFAYDSLLLSEMARAIGNKEDAERYEKLHGDISKAFVKAFVNTTTGKIQNDTQTSYLLAVAFKLVPHELIPKVMENLIENIKRHDWHPTTGFIGVGHLLPVLSDNGYNDIAYKLLLQNTYPSWMYMIENNATSMWEHWDSWTKEKGFASPKMNSFNQYALGSVGRWLFQYMGGIDTDNELVGFEKIIIKPHIGLGVNHTKAYYRSIKGMIRVEWNVIGNTFDLNVTIPVNGKASIILPFLKEKWIREVPSGEYQFSVPL